MGASCSSQAGPDDDALLAAIRDGDSENVRKFFATSRFRGQTFKYYLWASQVSALHVASNEGHLGVLQALVDWVQPRPGATSKERTLFLAFLNKANSYGQTALMLACKNGHVEIVRHLLQMGADPLVPDKVHSRTCLHYAAWNGCADCLSLLLSEECTVRLFNGLVGGAQEAVVTDALGTSRMVDMRSESGLTPLHFAVSASTAAAVKVLLEKGASLTAEVTQGACYSTWPQRSTPLHIAAAKGSVSVTRLLLQAQANAPSINGDIRCWRDGNGRQPVEIARMLAHARLEHLLDPAVPLRHAAHGHSHRSLRALGAPALSVLAGKCVQAALLAQLDLLGWQLRLRDGADAAMPASLKRQLRKSGKGARAAEAAVAPPEPEPEPGALPEASARAGGGGGESAVSSDCEEKDAAGEAAAPAAEGEAADGSSGCGDGEDGEPPKARGAAAGRNQECGVCLDRRTQLLIGQCSHECCYECGLQLVKKTKLSRSSIRCPFCRALIGQFELKDKSNLPLMVRRPAGAEAGRRASQPAPLPAQ